MKTAIEQFELNGLPAVRITAPDGASAVLMQRGGQLVSWTPAGGQERIFLSERARFDAGAAIRGGVPVCFPQFGSRGPLPKHGFVRTMDWTPGEARGGEDYATATMTLCDNAQTRSLWPHPFALELTVLVSRARLDIELGVRNPGETAMRFTCALHTYLRTREVEQTQIEGLRGLRYLDATRGSEHVESGTELSIEAETDRIYFRATRPLLVREPHRSLGISAEHLPDVVVWNPWEHLCGALPDMPANGFRHMLCIEAGAIGEPVELAPGAEWWGRQSLVAL